MKRKPEWDLMDYLLAPEPKRKSKPKPQSK
jgi:hypothetical protein